MILLAVLALGVVSVALSGGRLAPLAQVGLRGTPLVVAGFVAQFAVVTLFPDGSPVVNETVHVASYLPVGVFFWLNRRIPGLWLVALGGAANFAAITANGGVMPATPGALAEAGLPETTTGFANSAAVASPRLWWLGDVFAVPAGWPLANVFSVGDVCVLAGAIYGLHCICGTRLVRRRRVPRWRAGQGAGGQAGGG